MHIGKEIGMKKNLVNALIDSLADFVKGDEEVEKIEKGAIDLLENGLNKVLPAPEDEVIDTEEVTDEYVSQN